MADTFDYNEYKKRVRQAESSGNDKAVSAANASGRYQFVKSTWEDLGYNWKDRFNPQLQEEAMKKFTDKNVTFFRKRYGREPDFADVYGMHHLGAGGYSNVLDNSEQPITSYYNQDTLNKNPHFKKYSKVGELKNIMIEKMYGENAKQLSDTNRVDTSENSTDIIHTPIPIFDLETNTGQLASAPDRERTTEEKSDIAKINLLQDQLNVMMEMMQQQQPAQQQALQTPQQQPEPTFNYLTDTNLFTIT